MSVSVNEHAPQPDITDVQKRTLAEVNVRIVNCSCSTSEPRNDQVHAFPIDIELATSQVQFHMMEDVSEPEDQQAQSSVAELTERMLSPLRWLQACSAAVSGFFATGHALLNPSAKQFANWCTKQHAIRIDTLPVAFHEQGALLAVARASGAVEVYGLANIHMPRACDLLEVSMTTDSGSSGLAHSAMHRQRPPLFTTVRLHHTHAGCRAIVSQNGTSCRYPCPTLAGLTSVQAPHVLQATSQQKIHDQAWQPLSDSTLAVAHAGGVSLWRHVDQSRSPAMHRFHLQKGTLSPYIQHRLPWSSTAAATALAWHPKGSMLAAASLQDSCLFVWDANLVQQEPECVRLPGHTGTHLLKWSPCGHYLFVGLNDGTFRIFETLTWRSEAWSHVSCGYVIDVAWSATAQPPALILCCSSQLASLHFTEEAPSLDAQLMPLAAPQVFEQEVSSSAHSQWAQPSRQAGRSQKPLDAEEVVCGMVWDSKKERLLVSLCGAHALAGHMLLYTTVQSPVLSAVCLGPVYLPQCRQEPAPGPIRTFLGRTWDQGPSIQDEVRTGVRGTVALQCNNPMGTLLAARCGEKLVTVLPVAVHDATAQIMHGRGGRGMDSYNGSTTTLC